MSKGRIPFRVALDLTPDDLPDGAYFAMAHEIAGLEYGAGFDELWNEDETATQHDLRVNGFNCSECRKRFRLIGSFNQHNAMKHGGRATARKGEGK